jgi:aminoglycoside 3-N-acetyltransferase I
MEIIVKRLGLKNRLEARRLFSMLAESFDEKCAPLSDAYLDQLLSRKNFWALAAFAGDDIIGGITAHTLPMTYQESSEIFIFDVAVRSAHRKKGIGRRLLTALREQASKDGIQELFLMAENEDKHALEFYRRLGGKPTQTTVFVFSQDDSPLRDSLATKD